MANGIRKQSKYYYRVGPTKFKATEVLLEKKIPTNDKFWSATS